ncbi:MAG: glucuronyl hydrolase [Bacteroidota bacterium]
MKKIILALGCGLFFYGCQQLMRDVVQVQKVDQTFLTDQLTVLAQKAKKDIQSYPIDSTRFPRSLEADKSIHATASRSWTSGFYPGTLWYLYAFSDDAELKEAAATWTDYVEKEKWDTHTHDLGFKLNCSHGLAYEMTGEVAYKDVVVTASNTLIKRYNPNVGAIRSWDFNKENWDFPVIIDNMMNLEMLFEATEMTGDSIYHNIAHQHALTTLDNHFRDDYSTYHVIDYNPETGAVRKRNTHQGNSDDSAWSRGQAWGLYGYAMSYGKTKDKRFLKQAEAIADYFFTHERMPKDLIPYWDFDAPDIPNEPRDVSAATIAASALIELADYVPAKREQYLEWADTILLSLSQDSYQTKAVPFFLNQSVGNKPGNSEINTPLVYADYYYVEALRRRLKSLS